MKPKYLHYGLSLLTAAAAMAFVPSALAQNAPPKYSADVPKSILTPDKVETELLGTLEFSDGMPSKATVEKTYNFLDLARGAEAFLNGIPAASVYAFLEGFKEAGMKTGDLGIFEEIGRASCRERVYVLV